MHMLILFFIIPARELNFGVCYLREKSTPFTNFQPNWTTRSKVTNFSHFICRLSLSKSGGDMQVRTCGGGFTCHLLTHHLQHVSAAQCSGPSSIVQFSLALGWLNRKINEIMKKKKRRKKTCKSAEHLSRKLWRYNHFPEEKNWSSQFCILTKLWQFQFNKK